MQNVRNGFFYISVFSKNCSSDAEEDETDDPGNKAVREKERRQANNIRERYVVARKRIICNPVYSFPS